jgi:nitrate reductase gamma subunit
LPKDIFTAILIFLMILSGVVTIFSNIDIFNDDERDE